MFTGIIEGSGRLSGRRQVGGATRLEFTHPFSDGDLNPGDSVAVNGCCLTAVSPGRDTFAADVSPETLSKTTMKHWGSGLVLNMERALTPTTRMGGHFVTGHVDGLGHLVSDREEGGCWTMTFRVPKDLARYLAPKGSVAIDGVSLTVAKVTGETFEVAVIPTTRELTNFGSLRSGAEVHLEMDVLAKYVEALMARAPTKLDENFLAAHGFLR